MDQQNYHSISKKLRFLLSPQNMEHIFQIIFNILILLIALRIGKTSVFLVFLLCLNFGKMILDHRLSIPKRIDLLLLTLAFGSYFIIEIINMDNLSMARIFSLGFHLLSMPLLYWLGWQVINAQHTILQQHALFQRTVFLITGGNVLFAFLSLFKKMAFPAWYDAAFLAGRYGDNGLNSSYWILSVVDFWNNETILATGYNMHFVYLIALFPIMLWFRRYRILSIGVVIGAIVALWAIDITGSRSNLMLILISLMFAIWYKYMTITKIPVPDAKSPRQMIITRLKFILSIVLILLTVLVLVFVIDDFHLLRSSDMFQKKGFGIDSILQDARWKFSLDVLKAIPSHPFGKIDLIAAHNLWLDIARAAGIIPMSLLILYSLTNMKLAKDIWQKFDKDSLTRLMGLSILLILNISFFLETIIRDLTSQLMFYNLIIGMLSRLVDDSEPIRLRLRP